MKKKLRDVTMVEHAMICSKWQSYTKPCVSEDGKYCPLKIFCVSVSNHDLAGIFDVEVEIDEETN